jgi:hypothetical protein
MKLEESRVSIFSTEAVLESRSRCAIMLSVSMKREYCFEEGRFRGADFFVAKLAAKLVYAHRREQPSLGVLCFLPFWQRFTSIPVGCSALSVLEVIERGAEPTMTIGLGPQLLGMKLSESLLNCPRDLTVRLLPRPGWSLQHASGRLAVRGMVKLECQYNSRHEGWRNAPERGPEILAASVRRYIHA